MRRGPTAHLRIVKEPAQQRVVYAGTHPGCCTALLLRSLYQQQPPARRSPPAVVTGARSTQGSPGRCSCGLRGRAAGPRGAQRRGRREPGSPDTRRCGLRRRVIYTATNNNNTHPLCTGPHRRGRTSPPTIGTRKNNFARGLRLHGSPGASCGALSALRPRISHRVVRGALRGCSDGARTPY